MKINKITSINNQKEYAEVLSIIKKMMDIPFSENSKEQKELDFLIEAIVKYEEKYYSVNTSIQEFIETLR